MKNSDKLVSKSYHPTKKELEEKIVIDATAEELAAAMFRVTPEKLVRYKASRKNCKKYVMFCKAVL